MLAATSTVVSAQNQSAILGQPSQIRFAIPNVTNQDKCHIEVSLPNQQKIAIDVDAPQFNAEVNFTPDQIGSTTLKWEGKRKNRGLNSVNACPGSGTIQISVSGNTEYIAQQWNQYFARVPEPIGECVKVGMDISQLKYQILADPNALLTGPEDQKLKPIYEKCEAFAKQNQPRKGAPCTLASQNNLRTTCDGVYAERQPDGRLKTISRTEAIKLQFEGKPWTVGVVETLDVRANRLKQEEEDKAKQAANIAAQKDAEEKERLFKLSPEYKKQQAALEIKRLADEKDAAIRAKKEQEDAALKTRKDLEQQDLLTLIPKLRELLRNTWGWDDAMIRNSINMETQNIRKQNPNFGDDQVRNAVYDLWAKRAKEKTNPEIVELKVPNAVQLAGVLPQDPDFVYPITNISSCDKHCLSLNDYRKTCSLVKNLTYQAAMMSTVGGLDARLLERRGAISDVMFKWENNQCVMQYVVTGIFSGKKEGCRVFGLVTAFAVGEPGGIVANRAYPISNHQNSTCRLY